MPGGPNIPNDREGKNSTPSRPPNPPVPGDTSSSAKPDTSSQTAAPTSTAIEPSPHAASKPFNPTIFPDYKPPATPRKLAEKDRIALSNTQNHQSIDDFLAALDNSFRYRPFTVGESPAPQQPRQPALRDPFSNVSDNVRSGGIKRRRSPPPLPFLSRSESIRKSEPPHCWDTLLGLSQLGEDTPGQANPERGPPLSIPPIPRTPSPSPNREDPPIPPSPKPHQSPWASPTSVPGEDRSERGKRGTSPFASTSGRHILPAVSRKYGPSGAAAGSRSRKSVRDMIEGIVKDPVDGLKVLVNQAMERKKARGLTFSKSQGEWASPATLPESSQPPASSSLLYDRMLALKTGGERFPPPIPPNPSGGLAIQGIDPALPSQRAGPPTRGWAASFTGSQPPHQLASSKLPGDDTKQKEKRRRKSSPPAPPRPARGCNTQVTSPQPLHPPAGSSTSGNGARKKENGRSRSPSPIPPKPTHRSHTSGADPQPPYSPTRLSPAEAATPVKETERPTSPPAVPSRPTRTFVRIPRGKSIPVQLPDPRSAQELWRAMPSLSRNSNLNAAAPPTEAVSAFEQIASAEDLFEADAGPPQVRMPEQPAQIPASAAAISQPVTQSTVQSPFQPVSTTPPAQPMPTFPPIKMPPLFQPIPMPPPLQPIQPLFGPSAPFRPRIPLRLYEQIKLPGLPEEDPWATYPEPQSDVDGLIPIFRLTPQDAAGLTKDQETILLYWKMHMEIYRPEPDTWFLHQKLSWIDQLKRRFWDALDDRRKQSMGSVWKRLDSDLVTYVDESESMVHEAIDDAAHGKLVPKEFEAEMKEILDQLDEGFEMFQEYFAVHMVKTAKYYQIPKNKIEDIVFTGQSVMLDRLWDEVVEPFNWGPEYWVSEKYRALPVWWDLADFFKRLEGSVATCLEVSEGIIHWSDDDEWDVTDEELEEFVAEIGDEGDGETDSAVAFDERIQVDLDEYFRDG